MKAMVIIFLISFLISCRENPRFLDQSGTVDTDFQIYISNESDAMPEEKNSEVLQETVPDRSAVPWDDNNEHNDEDVEQSTGSDIKEIEGENNDSESVEEVDNDSVTPVVIEKYDVVFTEIMYNPSMVSDSDGEYIEIFNRLAVDISLSDCWIAFNSKKFMMDESVVVKAKSFAVFTKNSNDQEGQFPLKTINLLNSSMEDKELELLCDGEVIDSVFYKPGCEGASFVFDVDFDGEQFNDVRSDNSCCEILEMENGDKGSPGSENSSCREEENNDATVDEDAVPVNDEETNDNEQDQIDEDLVVEDNDLYQDDSDEELCLTNVSAGDIIITEIMNNPDVVSDADGEYLELLNIAEKDLYICGCSINIRGDEKVFIETDELFSQGMYGVVGKQLLADKLIDTFFIGSDSLTLYNSNTEENLVELICGDVVVDSVVYLHDSAMKGRSIQLSSSVESAEQPDLANDDPENWCFSEEDTGYGDFGTPGRSNAACVYESTETQLCFSHFPLLYRAYDQLH